MISRQTNYLKGAITKMKRLFASVISCVLILSLICSGLTVFATTITGAVDTDNFVRGVDVSTLDMLEDLGARFYQNNVESDALTILKNNGANYVRLKLWVDPYDKTEILMVVVIMIMQPLWRWQGGQKTSEWEC